MAKALAQLAPGDHQAHGFKIADHERPDRARGRAPGFIGVGNAHLALLTNGGAHGGEIERVDGARLMRDGGELRVQHDRAQMLRHGGGELADQVARTAGERGIAPLRHPGGA